MFSIPRGIHVAVSSLGPYLPVRESDDRLLLDACGLERVPLLRLRSGGRLGLGGATSEVLARVHVHVELEPRRTDRSLRYLAPDLDGDEEDAAGGVHPMR